MKKEKVLYLLVFILTGITITGFLARSLYAEDYYIEKQTETSINGQPAGGVSTLKLWVKGDQVRYFNSSEKDTSLIIRMAEDKAYQLNEKEKTVKEMDLKSKFAALEKQIKVSAKKTEKKKKVDQWETYQVILTSTANGVSTEVEYWLTDKIKFPIETRKKMAAYFGQAKIIEELEKYPGYPVEIIVHLKVQDKKIDMSTRLITLENKKIDEALFKIPAEYKKEEASLYPPGPPPDPPQTSDKPAKEPKKEKK